MHECGFVHGNIEPSTIARFSGANNWKLMYLRGITPIGETMGGKLRFGAPPESVLATGGVRSFFSSFDRSTGGGGEGLTKLVSFDDEEGGSPVKHSSNKDTPDCEFRADVIKADVSWDVWSYGLIMGHLGKKTLEGVLSNFHFRKCSN